MLTTRMETHWNRVIRCYSERPNSVDEMFRSSLERARGADAVVVGDVRLSYSELDLRVSAVAAGLADREVERGDRVAVMLPNSAEAIICVLAIARLGAVIVPIGTRLREPEIQHIFEDSQPKAVVVDVDFEDRLPIGLKEPTTAMAYFCVGQSKLGLPLFDDLYNNDRRPPSVSVREDDLFGILYTSGTTGRPKGAMLTHLGAIHSCLHWVDCLGLTQGERAALCIPWSHVAGLCGIVLPFLGIGGCLVSVRDFNAREFLRVAERETITHALLVPAMYGLCRLVPDFASFDLSRWRLGVYGSAPMPEATIRHFSELLPHLTLCNAYGATETTSPATIMPPGEGLSRSDSIGKVVPCGEIRVMDGNGREVPPGEMGELWIRGPMVVPGYWRNPQADADAFLEGFWKSGDIGSVDAEGFVCIADRKKDMVNRGGFKVYPAEVENVISDVDGVIEVAVVGRPDDILTERVVAYVRTSTASVTDQKIRDFCSVRLADYKVPDWIVVTDEPLPRNANGKIQKAELRQMAEQLRR